MNGHVARGQPQVEVRLLQLDGAEAPLEFVVDTGFAGQLTLSPAVILRLALRYESQTVAQMADGAVRAVAAHRAIILWDGDEREVEVLALPGDRPLLGTELLAEHELVIQFAEGGHVFIEPL